MKRFKVVDVFSIPSKDLAIIKEYVKAKNAYPEEGTDLWFEHDEYVGNLYVCLTEMWYESDEEVQKLIGIITCPAYIKEWAKNKKGGETK